MLEDRILGEGPGDNYCSSSEDEAEPKAPEGPPLPQQPGSRNTGPKGVIRDFEKWQDFQKDAAVKEYKQMLTYANRLCLTGDAEPSNAESSSGTPDSEDEFLESYRKKRMEDMKRMFAAKRAASENKVQELNSGDDFLRYADLISMEKTVIIHVYDQSSKCSRLASTLSELAVAYPQAVFAAVPAAALPTSARFRAAALPVLQAYRRGELIANFVALHQDLDMEFDRGDVESFLKDYAVLNDPNQ